MAAGCYTAREKSAAAVAYRSEAWKRCHLCADAAAPRYDFWHVLFYRPATRETATMVGAHKICKAFVPLCEFFEAAVVCNSESMSNTSKAAVSHSDILDTAADVRVAVPG
jgi:hypothetical protein